MLKTKILLPDGTVLSSGLTEQYAILSASLTQKVNDQTELSPGSVCSSMLEATVLSPEGALQLNTGMEVTVYKDESCMGLFTLEKPSRASANTLKLTAYDRVSWLDKDLSRWLADLTEWPYSLHDLAVMVCEACGLTLANEELPNGSYLVQQFSASGITGRQLMQWIGQAAGRFCRTTVDGKLEFAWYAPAPVSIGTTAAEDATRGAVAVLENVPEGAMLCPVSSVTHDCEGITLRVSGKNLIDFVGLLGADYTNELNGLTCRIENGYATITGTHNVTGWTNILQAKRFNGSDSDVNITLPAGTYTVPNKLNVQLNNLITGKNTNYGGTFTLTEPHRLATFYIAYSGVGTVVNATIPLVIVAGDESPAEYLPYKGTQYTVTFPQSVSAGSYNWNSGQLSLADGGVLQLEKQSIPALGAENILISSCGDTAVSYRQLGCYQNSLKYEDYMVSPIERVQIRLTDSDVGVVYPDMEKGNTYVITGNYLLTAHSTEELLPLARTLYEQLKTVTYTPCQVSVPGDLALQAGQVVTVTDRNGYRFQTYIMDRTLSGQRDSLKSTGSASRDSTAAVNNKSLQALNGKVLELRAEVDGLRVENRDMADRATSLAIGVEGIKGEVSAQEKTNQDVKKRLTTMEQTADDIRLSVQSIQTDGASKVKTSMGYTFDDRGLHISKDGSNLENSVTEQGMYVKRNTDGAVMLQADANGVIATDVSVRNYLIVGNARFEEYTGGRTACFYFGG